MFVIKTPFTRVNIGSWQEKDLSIFQTQQECGENIPEVVVGSGMILEMRLVEGQQINSLGFPRDCRGVTSSAGIPLDLGKGQRQERAQSWFYRHFITHFPFQPQHVPGFHICSSHGCAWRLLLPSCLLCPGPAHAESSPARVQGFIYPQPNELCSGLEPLNP